MLDSFQYYGDYRTLWRFCRGNSCHGLYQKLYLGRKTLCRFTCPCKKKIILISTSLKDVVDIQGSIEWLLNHKEKILEVLYDYCSGCYVRWK